LCAVALLGLVRAGLPGRLTTGLTGASGAVHALAVLWSLPLVVLTLAGPLTGLEDIWSGAPAGAREALGLELPPSTLPAPPVILLLVATVLAAASRLPWPGAAAAATPGTPGPEGARSGTPGAPAHPGLPEGTARPPASTSAPAATPSRPSGDAPGTPGATTRPTGPPERPSGPAGAPGTSAPTGAAAGAAWGGWAPSGGAGAARPAGPAVSGVARRALAACGALVLAWAGLLVLPSSLDLNYPATVTLQLLLTAAALALAVRPGWVTRHAPTGDAVALACGLVGAVSAGLLSLATRPATFAVLGTLVAAFAAAAVTTRAHRAVQAVLACAGIVFATALVGAVGAAAELPPHHVALTLLAVPAAVALLAARPGGHPIALPMEFTGASAGLLAVALATGHRPTLALVLALCGVIAAGTAVRAERRPAAGYLAAVLFVLATWVRLAASDIAAPEAYTLPVTVPALVVGVLRRRRDPEASSWTAYGPGLAATLVPSLFAAWGDEHWPRPLLLGLAALALTLVGARLRLQALLVLGGAVLALDALHELAPYVVQAVGALPRWLPPALAGLLLLAVGATYEQRLRDARKLRDTLGRMR
ncbi:hypothetical protein HRW14_32680, partial [Streptomyces lunaelactis]|nr:hypothetical protein [Streptomyces lunaelactis]